VQSIDPNRATPERLNLAKISGRLALRYVDRSGVEHPQWPPFGASIEHVLPSAVIVRDRFGQQEAHLAAAYGGSTRRTGDSIGQVFGGAR
jgi:hypothetical protein